ncbi:MAG TPA: sigma-54 dependent transcriptional regulator [Acidobacteriaceae bacterium]|nr:sigma-54 dependent transcriptional regulator [Acidobacteriaceae bacterium]
MDQKVLIVEDERNARMGLAELISGWGYSTAVAQDGVEALERLQEWNPTILVSDLKMPRMDGLTLLRHLGELEQKLAVIMLTAQGSIESAVESMKLGAFDYIQKPVDPVRLKRILSSASSQQEAEHYIDTVRSNSRQTGVLGSLVGKSAHMQEIFTLIERIAPNNVSVLITGESGTGKEVVARTLHDLSGRSNKPFVAVNCAAIPETLIESEIFGHERGAFTGAVERRAGCFELAEEGTLLLDEIGEMPIATQAKLLRVLEDRTLRRLGSKVETPINVRVLAATNKDPLTAIEEGHLRNDLFYRLNVFNIHMPALREHREDIPLITEFMIRTMNERHGCKVNGVEPAVLQEFETYNWPGNVRELRNVLERAVVLCGSGTLRPQHLPRGFGAVRNAVTKDPDKVQMPVGTTVDEAEKRLIVRTLEFTGNNKTRAADILGISLKTLHNKLKEYGGSASSSD